MSVEYEVRSDDDYSRPASASEARSILVERWGVRDLGGGMLLYERDECYVEVTLGSGETAARGDERIQWIGLRVPAGAPLESGQRAVEIGMGLARALGWRLHDPQSDRYIDPAELEPAPSLREALGRLVAEVRREPAPTLLRRLWLRSRRQSARSLAEIAFAGLVVALVYGRLRGLDIFERPALTLSIVVVITVLLAAADIVLDVLGEIHTDADARRGRIPGK